MTFRLTPYGKTRAPLPGVPWRDLTDEEMAAAEALHPGIGERGYFQQDIPAPEPTPEPEPKPLPRRYVRPKRED